MRCQGKAHGAPPAYTGKERGEQMKLDRKALERLLSLNDAQLRAVIDRLASEYGLDLSQLQIKEGDMAGLRRFLQGTSDAELAAFLQNLHRGG